jgi:hypothetical protein
MLPWVTDVAVTRSTFFCYGLVLLSAVWMLKCFCHCVIWCLYTASNMGLLRSESTSFICLFCFCVLNMWYTYFSKFSSCLYYFQFVLPTPIFISRVYYVLCFSRRVFVVLYCACMFVKPCFERMSCLTYILHYFHIEFYCCDLFARVFYVDVFKYVGSFFEVCNAYIARLKLKENIQTFAMLPGSYSAIVYYGGGMGVLHLLSTNGFSSADTFLAVVMW